MNIEELKVVLEMVKGVSNGAVDVALVWMAREYFTTLIGAGVGVFAIVKVGALLTRIIDNVGMAATLRDLLGVGEYSFGVKERKKVIDILSKELGTTAR